MDTGNTGPTSTPVQGIRISIAKAAPPAPPPPAPAPTPICEPAGYFAQFAEQLNLVAAAGAVARIARAITGRPTLRLAYIGNGVALWASEAIADAGFSTWSFFAGDPSDRFHPSRPLNDFSAAEFDAAFVSDRDPARAERLMTAFRRAWGGAGGPIAVDIDRLAAAQRATLQQIPGSLETCLNPNKLATIAAAVCLAPPRGCVVEAGVAYGGTTVFMAKMQAALGIARTIYALDTFGGMPAPVAQDGATVYTADLFRDSSVERVRATYQRHGVDGQIQIRPGLVQQTLPAVVDQAGSVSLMLLDTDQYSGTKGGLDHALPRLAPGGLVIVDDTSVAGVDLALREAARQFPHLRRAPVVTNFDLLWMADAAAR